MPRWIWALLTKEKGCVQKVGCSVCFLHCGVYKHIVLLCLHMPDFARILEAICHHFLIMHIFSSMDISSVQGSAQ